MTWARPEWLGLLWTLPVIVILRLLVGRRDRRIVATLSLWRRVAASLPLRRRRRWWPPLEVVGEVVVAGTMILALAGPVLRDDSRPAPLLVVVDRGGSMEAPKRRAEWQDILNDLAAAAMAEGRDVSVRPEPDALEPMGGSRVGGVDLARRLAARRPRTPRVLVTDRRLPLALPESVGLRGVRSPLDNVGIVAAWLDRTGARSRLHLALAASREGAARRPHVRVEWDGGARVLGPLKPDEIVRVFDLPPGGAVRGDIRLELLGDGETAWNDDFPADDVATLSTPPRRLRFLVLPSEEAFAHALEALGETVIIGRDPSSPESTFAVGRRRPPDVAGALLLPPAQGGAGRLGDVVPGGAGALVFEGEGLAELPLAGLKIPRAREVSGPGLPLLRLRGKTVAMAFPHRSEVVLGFDPVAAAWDAEPVFPLILRAWLGRVAGKRSGMPLFVAADPAATRAEPPPWEDRPWRVAAQEEGALDAGSGRPLDRWVFAAATAFLVVFGALLLRSKTL
ncbi:MAG TPA: hypothetical protein ENK43_17100 [Planctomycetes bacterium]|nr:hypothetical protein [Planctomycetota bacterium]